VTSVIAINQRVQQAKHMASGRDIRMRDIRMVRAGDVETLYPGMFSEDFPKPIVANVIDSCARDLAETIAPLPALKCSSKTMVTEADRKRAARKDHIGHSYWEASKLGVQMFSAADQFLSYGFLPFYAEVDFARKTPVIRAEDPVGAYYSKDRFGVVRWYAKVWAEPAAALAAKFPELAVQILRPASVWEEADPNRQLQVVRYCDADEWVMYLPDCHNLILSRYDNLTDQCPVQVAERPGLDSEQRGQWDQVAWVQMARARFAMLSLEAAHKAVTAPLVMPKDVSELALGADSVIQTDNPQGVGRVRMELPQSALMFGEKLDDELKIGSRYPEGRMGGVDASVITGRGVQALLGGFDTQINTAQVLLGEAIARVTEFCFELDVKVFGGRKKRIQGTMSGKPYDFEYAPTSDIQDNYRCAVTYGYAAGMAPNQAIVALLQLRGDNLISRRTFRDQLPFDTDPDQEQRDIDLEQTSDAMLQGLFALLQSVGPMALQGGDPMSVIQAGAKFMDLRQRGKDVKTAMIEAFTPPEPTPEEQAAMQAQAEAEAQAQAQVQGAVPGIGPDGLPPDVAPGQAGMAPGGQPDIATLVADLRNGQPSMSAGVSRRRAI
jgi:hypothetical protein